MNKFRQAPVPLHLMPKQHKHAQKKARKLVRRIVRLLRYLSGGQGHAGISVFDSGAGGGFVQGQVQIFLERDGRDFDHTVYAQNELIELILIALYDERKAPGERRLRANFLLDYIK
jgi:hypothetical protein